MIDWKPNRDSGVEAELVDGDFRVSLWAWPTIDAGRLMYSARVLVEHRRDSEEETFDENADDAESQEEAQQKAADLLQLYLDGDPEEQAFKAKLRAWVAS